MIQPLKTANLLLAALLLGSMLPLNAQEKPKQTDTLYVNLDKALEIALSTNPTIKIADKEVERANYIKDESYGYLFPTVTGVGSFSRNLTDNKFIISKENNIMFTIPATNTFNAGVSLNVPIFSMGIYKSIQLSESNIKVALEAARASKIDLKNQVERAYYSVLMSRNAYDVMGISLKSAEENAKNIKLKYEQGKVAEFDMLRADVQVSNIRPSYLQAKNSSQIADMQLKLLMGVPLEVPVKVEGNLTDFESDYKNYPIGEAQHYSLDNNADLRKLDLQSQVLQKQLEIQKTNRMPYLAGSFSYMFSAQDPTFKFADYDWYGVPTVGLSLNVPIFSGFTNKNKEKQIGATINQLQLQREYTASSLNVGVRNAINSVNNAVEQIEANINSIRQAQKAYNISKTRYDSGVGTLLEVNDAEVALTQAQLNYNQAIYNYLLAKSDYTKLLGNSF